MNDEEKQKTLLEIDYNKLLAYLGGSLVSFFTLFQLSTEPTLNPWLVVILALSMLGGIIFLTCAAFKNFMQIIELENKLGLSELDNPSGWFSKWKKEKEGKEREISKRLIIIGIFYIIISIILTLFIVWNSIGVLLLQLT